MKSLRTPDERFANLSDYPFSPHYVTVGNDLRMHYVDEGPSNAEIVLLMHGEPSWSYLYRKMIPHFVDAGYRVIAPDLIGFGRSDKPVEMADYSYASHTAWTLDFIEQLDLTGINLFCQDWGGLIGLRIAGLHHERFARIVAGNTFLPNGKGKPSEAFLQWQEFSKTAPKLPIHKIMQNSTVTELSQAELDAYWAPFPDVSYMAGAKIFPSLVPTSEDDVAIPTNLEAWSTLAKSKKPFLCLFSDQDPITAGGDKIFIKHMAGAAGMPHQTIEGGGHFLQEDKGESIAKIMIDFMQKL